MDPRQNAIDQLRECEATIKTASERAAKLKTFLSLYDELYLAEEVAQPVPSLPDSRPDQIIPPVVRRNRSIPDVVEEILADGIPRKTEVLVEMLKERGVTMATARPVVNLSSTLSREKTRFVSNRRIGWKLKKAKESSAATDDSFILNGASQGAHELA